MMGRAGPWVEQQPNAKGVTFFSQNGHEDII